jgi:hypothetical protein
VAFYLATVRASANSSPGRRRQPRIDDQQK